MKKPSSKVLIAAAVAIVVVAAIAAFLLSRQAGPAAPKAKDVLIIGTTDSIQTTLDPCEAYDYLGVNIIENMGG
ncbi:MAG: hypothetical protein ACO2OQ_02710, partial [Thermofilaceae archaeon]